MITLLLHVLRVLPFLFGGHRQLAVENLALRQQLAVYSGSRWPPPSLRPTGRLIQPSRFATFSPALPSGCSPPHPQTLRSLQWWPDAPAGRPSCLQSPSVLGLSREHRPSSTEGDERFWRRTGVLHDEAGSAG